MTQALVSPVAIDAFVRIEAVKVAGRHRKDLGDLNPLAASIADVGLINPITLTTDSRLIAGQRRLEACRQLGWTEVPVRIVARLDEAEVQLRAERDENICRKDMTPDELVFLGLAMEELERPDALDRRRNGGDTGRASRYGEDLASSRTQGSQPEGEKKARETISIVGAALGIGRDRYFQARKIVKLATDPGQPQPVRQIAQDAREEMNATGKITTAYEHMKDDLRQLQAREEAQESKAAVLAEGEDPNWTPEPKDRSATARQRREEILREMATSGYTSPQIGTKLGQRDGHIRQIARELGVTINADEALGVRTRKTIDSNRVVRETAIALEGLAMGAQLVNINDLDPAEIDGWASSMTASIRTLNRLVRQLKEKTP